MSNTLTEQEVAEIQATRTAPKITPEDLEALIVHEEYWHPEFAPHFTVCLLMTEHGFIVSGESAPASPENYDDNLAKHYAREKAINKLWPMEGYRLRAQLALAEAA